jgi:hypothetical protein
MRHSCGALIYTVDRDGSTGIILGKEGNHWFPFKGCCEANESYIILTF